MAWVLVIAACGGEAAEPVDIRSTSEASAEEGTLGRAGEAEIERPALAGRCVRIIDDRCNGVAIANCGDAGPGCEVLPTDVPLIWCCR